jgi:cell fate (sporulation/competence/biofilm development) regulator YmcA (YheA/YmcA/DUF963 family)
MNIFRIISLTSLLIASGIISFSCGQISQNEKRAKLQFLYQMKNTASLSNEFTYRIKKKKDLEQFKTRMTGIQNDIDNVSIVESWQRSREIKNEFAEIILRNINVTDSLISEIDSLFTNEIDYLPAIVELKDNQSRFLEQLDLIISQTDKEN